jgi:serine/threonine-protein kinase 24/25/MST4
MDAREIESLSMLSRGFTELKEANPELTYNVILDILSGINECVLSSSSSRLTDNVLLAQQRVCEESCANFKGLIPTQANNSP